ncbi:hypothetical protein ABPG72_021143 [Tetrahymena utriculariae]
MIFLIIQGLVISFVLYLVGKFIVLPKLRMQFYKNQNIKEFNFFPFYGWFWDSILQRTNKHKDCIHQIKHISESAEFKDQDIILSNLNSKASLLIVNPDLISEFLQCQQHYIKYELPFHSLNKLIGTGLAKHYGDGWKKSRKILSNMFTFEQIALQLGCIRELSKRYISQQNEKSFNMQKVFEMASGASDLSIFLGFDMDQYKNKDGKTLGELIGSFANDVYLRDVGMFSMIFGTKATELGLRKSDKELNERGKNLRKFMYEIILECKKREQQPGYQPKYPSFIHHLVQENLLNTEEELEDLLAISFNLFLAAKETTSKIAANVVYYAIKYPEQYKKIQEEIKTYVPNDEYTFADLQKMNILQANVKECLRYDTSGPFLFQREVVQDHTLGKYNIKKGTLVNCGYVVNFFNEKYFENPFSYQPERWFDSNNDVKMKNSHLVYIPFSGGARNCIGQHLAVMQIKAMVIEFFKKFKLPEIPKDFDDEKIMTLSYGFKNDLLLNLERM